MHQCQECEGLYCEWCAEETKKEKKKAEKDDAEVAKPTCCNADCNSETFKTSPIGKILKSMIETFEFKHECQETLYKYTALVQHSESDCALNKKLKCPVKDCTT